MTKATALKKLSKIQKEIARRYENNVIHRYNIGKRVHKKQLEFHKCCKKNRWVFGGNRSGKTECGAVETVWFARGIHPYKENKKNINCWVISLSTQVQRDVAQSKILYYLNKSWVEDIIMLQGKKNSPENGIIDTILIKNIYGGISRIGFKSCDQGREKFQGTSLDFVWFDEEPPYDIYLECKMRVIDKCGQLFGTMTPLKGLTWVYHEIYLNENNDPNIWHIHMEWADNPYLNQEEIKSLASAMNETELNSRQFGNFSLSGGMVYNEFNENVHVIDPFQIPTDWYDCISIDPGLNNPLSCHWYACDYDGNIYVMAEHFEAKKDINYHSSEIKFICKKLNWPKLSNGNYYSLIDSAANQKTLSSAKSVSELFYDYGITVNSNVKKDVFSGIQRVKNYLKNAQGETKIYVFKTCVNLIREFKSYAWGKADSPIKNDDHALDELRYYIMNKPEVPLKKLEKSLIQKDKERLMKKNKNNYFLK